MTKSDTQSSGYPSSGSRSGDMESQFRETGSARESQCGDTCSTRSSVSGDSDSYRDVIQSVLTQSPGSTAAMTGPGVISGRGSRTSDQSSMTNFPRYVIYLQLKTFRTESRRSSIEPVGFLFFFGEAASTMSSQYLLILL